VRTKIDINQFKFNITNLIVDYYDYYDYVVSDEPFAANFVSVIVKSFKNSDEAYGFYQKVNGSDQVFAEIDASDYQYFIISELNYKALLQEKIISSYINFFKANYLR